MRLMTRPLSLDENEKDPTCIGAHARAASPELPGDMPAHMCIGHAGNAAFASEMVSEMATRIRGRERDKRRSCEA